ncbi:MAG: hypothetical protein M3120_06095 [Pseudomonadota bacterium]|nr:hypothetical protein [Pseudomonadota bacterium]
MRPWQFSLIKRLIGSRNQSGVGVDLAMTAEFRHARAERERYGASAGSELLAAM